MDVIPTLATSISALLSIGILGFLLRVNKAQRRLHKDQEKFLHQQLKEAREALTYAGSTTPKPVQRALAPTASPTPAVIGRRLFISTPVRGFNDDDFTDFVEQVSRMIDGMNATRRFGAIFYENYRFANKEVFEARRLPVREYFAELERADVFVAIVPMPSLSSVYYEAGYAVALGKPSVYFVPEGAGKVLPSLMGEAHRLMENVSTVLFDSLDHVQRVLVEEFGGN
jgi:nucleoside 2-deoxyribosyltransferase